jgi:hypothetical protein
MSKVSKKKWLWIGSAAAAAIFAALLICGSVVTRRFEPFLRQQSILYLQKRFECNVRLASIRISLPSISPIRILFTGGRGMIAHVEGSGLFMQKPNAEAPLITAQTFAFDVDAGSIFEKVRRVGVVELDGVSINIPPKAERAGTLRQSKDGGTFDIAEILARNVTLAIIPAVSGKKPLIFVISIVRLETAGQGSPMQYNAELINPKPPGVIHSQGSFGPWSAEEPGATALRGVYTFERADLSAFPAIAGILNSQGSFAGSLSAIVAKGSATVPDFRLRTSGNPVPLSTQFEVQVDGTNGNTVLQPVRAVLGTTHLTTSGAVLRNNGDAVRTISLNVTMPAGNLEDVMRLAVKGAPMMEGKLFMESTILLPPLSEKVSQKLILDGDFKIDRGRFRNAGIQDKIDSLSRRGQGQPKNTEIDDVFSDMSGRFHLENRTITFRSLSFDTPGAAVHLAGVYRLGDDSLDLRGSLSLDAKVSQMVTGWKRILLKPVDPFFAKNGAGTYLRIRIDGDAKSPHFGLDHFKP